MIYVPELENYDCYVVQSEGVIRAYEQTPYTGGTFNYRDYYINNSYIYRDGEQQFGSYSTVPSCLANDSLTDAIYYRLDIDKIFLVFFIIVFICYFIMKKLVRVFFHGFREA